MARPWRRIDARSLDVDTRDAAIPVNRGVFRDRSKATIPQGGMVDALNARVERGTLTNENVGWQNFPLLQALTLNLEARPVLLIEDHVSRTQVHLTVFGTDRDLYQFMPGTGDVQYLNPRYEAGTITIVGTAATFSNDIVAAGLKTGDYLHRSTAGQTATPVSAVPELDWTRMTVTGAFTATLDSAPGDVAGVVFTVRRVFAGGILKPWDTEMFPNALPGNNDLLFATNGETDGAWKWNGIADQVTLITLTLGFTFKSLTRASNVMVYGNLVEGGQLLPETVATSAIGEPENVSTLEATRIAVASGDAEIVSVRRLHNTVIVYKGGVAQGSAHQLDFIGAPFQWAIRTAVGNRGPLSGRAIAEFSDYHEFLAGDRAYRFDGVSLVPMGSHVFREVLRSHDSARVVQTIAHVNEQFGEVFWVTPLTTDTIPAGVAEAVPQTAYVAHYLEEETVRSGIPIVPREVPNVTVIGEVQRETALRFVDVTQQFALSNFPFNDRFFSVSYPQMIFGDALGNVWIGNIGSSQAGASMRSFGRFGRFIGDGRFGRRTALIKRIFPQFVDQPAADYTVQVSVEVANHVEGVTRGVGHAGEVNPRNDGTTPDHAFIRARGRFYDIVIETEGVEHAWRLSGIGWDREIAGRRP